MLAMGFSQPFVINSVILWSIIIQAQILQMAGSREWRKAEI